MLDHVAGYQRKGEVRDLYKYLKRARQNWARRIAEERAQFASEQRVHRAHMDRPLPRSIAEITLRNFEANDAEIRAGRAFRTAAKRARHARCSAIAVGVLGRCSGFWKGTE